MMLQGGLTQEEDKNLQIINAVPSVTFALFSGFGSFVGWFGLGLGSSFPLLMIFDNVIRLAVLNRVKQFTAAASLAVYSSKKIRVKQGTFS
jgi:hypothetical protein